MRAWRGLEVDGRSVVLSGADAAAVPTVAGLLDAGARVRLLAAEATPALQDLADRGRLELITEASTPAALDGAALVVATGGPQDAEILAAATERGLLTTSVITTDRPATRDRIGEVILVGGGPGDPGLLTVAGLQAIKEADVIATDRLAPLAALAEAREDAEIIDVGKIPRGAGARQRSIEELLITRAKAGHKVVRFKGGDNFVFGRGGEEWQACAAAGVPVTIIPGVTSATAAPAAAGIPVTHRQLSQGFTVVTGHVPPGDPGSTIDWPALARSGCTLVIMMGMANLRAIAETLINNGLPAGTPAAVIEDGTLASMRTLRAPLDQLADRTAAEGLGAPATVIIGEVAAFSPTV